MYQALSRKYRPRILTDLVGQEVVAQIISNAISTGRMHHAFLFTGTRGVGKTTIARIIALSINCLSKDEHGNSNANPCLVCKNCIQILNHAHPDVMEFDAASKTGVDAMREVLDSCIYPPIMGLYKVYIIDEVHMLSKAAFNSMLKTLEEPCAYIKFIFATTEIKKVPMTILSRCQKFFLRNVSTSEIKKHIVDIADREGISCDSAVLDTIAHAADGSVRDALSLLDQALILSADSKIDLAVVRGMLGLNNMGLISELFDHIVQRDAVASLMMVQKLIGYNAEYMLIIHGIMEIISLALKSMFCKENNIPPSIPHAHDVLAVIEKHRATLSVSMLLRMWQIATKSLEECSYISHAMALEMLCIKLIYFASLPTPEQILQKAESCA